MLHLQRTDLFNAHPKSLQFDRGTDEPKPEVATSRLRQALLTISGFYSKESQLLRGIVLVLAHAQAVAVVALPVVSQPWLAMTCREQKSLSGSCATGCKQTAI